MAKSILILDDDADFNNLLTDIFTQADYDVTSERDPESAVGVFQSKHFDLVVTDQKMPGLTGEEFIREIKNIRSDIPVIMVSGYLDNDTIRNLIKEGVGGVFLKPLNVFSLLKKTSSLIEESEASRQRMSLQDEKEGALENLTYQHQLPFDFTTFPCKAAKSLDFAKKLYSLRNFKANLIVIGAHGTDFANIVEDLRGFDPSNSERFEFVELANINAPSLNRIVDEAESQAANRITLVIDSTENLDADQKKFIFQLVKHEGPFSTVRTDIRYVFCLSDDIDALYDRGEIDDDIYMFMGTSEVKVPSFSDIRDDIPILAYSYLKSEALARNMSQVPKLDTGAKVYLHEKDWEGNALELKRLVSYAITEVQGEVMTRQHFELALEKQSRLASSDGTAGFRNRMVQYRDDYAKAVFMLSGKDKVKTSQLLGVDASLVDDILKGFEH